MMSMKNLYKVATLEEIREYQNALYPLQDIVLSFLPTFDDFYLTGGTALARFYLNHRLSEDADHSHEFMGFSPGVSNDQSSIDPCTQKAAS